MTLPEDKKKWAEYSTLGMMFPASIAVGLTIGYLLDEIFHTSPYLLILFTLYGIAAGFYHLFKITGKHNKPQKKHGSQHITNDLDQTTNDQMPDDR